MFTKDDFWVVLLGVFSGVINYTLAKVVFAAFLGVAYVKFGLACSVVFLCIVVGYMFYWIHTSASAKEYQTASLLAVMSICLLASFGGMFAAQLPLMRGPWF